MTSAELRRLFDDFAGAVAYVAVRSNDGTEGIGSAFHIGEGVFITARHVVEGKEITEIGTTERSIKLGEYTASDSQFQVVTDMSMPGIGQISRGPLFHPDPDIDVAILIVEGINAPSIPLGDHLDDWLGNELILSEVIILGYPPIPFSGTPILVATKAEINTILDKYTGGHPHFIVSAMARGGFSGGPAISKYGFCLGIVTESLGMNDQPLEIGYLSVLTIEPIYVCLAHHNAVTEDIERQWEGFWNTEDIHYRFTPNRGNNPSISICMGKLYRYIKLYCDDPEILKQATELVKGDGDVKCTLEEVHGAMTIIHFDRETVTEEDVRDLYQKANELYLRLGLLEGIF